MTTQRIHALQSVGDVSGLPTATFGARSLMWWGTLGFMVIEGWTLALLFGVFSYLRQRAGSWPPTGTPFPSLRSPIINLALLTVSILPNVFAARAASRFQKRHVQVWLVISCVLCLVILPVRWWELWAVNTRWDSNAYGSAVWVMVGYHTQLLVVDVADTMVLTLFFLFKRLPAKAYSDVSDNAFYWYFTVISWLPIFLMVYLAPYLR